LVGLKIEPGSDLDHSREVVLTGDLAKVRITHAGVGREELGSIEEVEKFHPELSIQPLIESRVLKQREIEIFRPIGPQIWFHTGIVAVGVVVGE
jgi:hypothetical protein